jgi:hypothetical protein
MASRILNRMRPREQADQAAQVEPEVVAGDDVVAADAPAVKKRVRKASAKAPGEKAAPKPRVRKKSIKAAPRMFARWAVCDAALKRLALFDYKDRAGADAKLLHLQEQKKGLFVIQLVKDAYEPPVVEAVDGPVAEPVLV